MGSALNGLSSAETRCQPRISGVQTKSIDEMLRLLAILGYRADVRIVEIAA
jgi:hypothetical protein